MAAIDPDETPELEDGVDPSRPRATLKIIRPPPGLDLDEEEDSDEDDEDDEEDSDDEETNGGPSDKEKARKLKEAAVLKDMEEDDDEEDDDDDEDEEFDLQAAISKLVKGKAPATDEDDDDESDEGLDVDEMVVCTLDPEKVKLQQPMTIPILDEANRNLLCSTTSSLLTSLSLRASAFSSRSLVLTAST